MEKLAVILLILISMCFSMQVDSAQAGGSFYIDDFLNGYKNQEYVIDIIGEPFMREGFIDITDEVPHEGFLYYLEGETVLMVIYFHYYYDECRCWGIEEVEFYPIRNTDRKIESHE